MNQRDPENERLKADWLARNLPTIGPLADCRQGYGWLEELRSFMPVREDEDEPKAKRKSWKRINLHRHPARVAACP